MRSAWTTLPLALALLTSAAALSAANLVGMTGYVAVRAPGAKQFAYAEPLQDVAIGTVLHTRAASGVSVQLLPNVWILMGEYTTVRIKALDTDKRKVSVQVIEGSIIASAFDRLPVELRIEGQAGNLTLPVGLVSYSRLARTEYALVYRGDQVKPRRKDRNNFGTRFVQIDASALFQPATVVGDLDSREQLAELFRWLEQTGQSTRAPDPVAPAIVFSSLEELRKQFS